MTSAEVVEKMKSGWMLVVNRDEKKAANGDITCGNVTGVTLSMDGEPDVKLPVNIFDEISSQLAEPDRDHGCMFIYSLA